MRKRKAKKYRRMNITRNVSCQNIMRHWRKKREKEEWEDQEKMGEKKGHKGYRGEGKNEEDQENIVIRKWR